MHEPDSKAPKMDTNSCPLKNLKRMKKVTRKHRLRIRSTQSSFLVECGMIQTKSAPCGPQGEQCPPLIYISAAVVSILRISNMDHVSNADVCLRAGSPPQLLPLIQTRHFRFFGHVARMGDSRDLSRALHTSDRGLPKDWRRRPGRPRHTWLRTLEADLQPLNHGLNSAW